MPNPITLPGIRPGTILVLALACGVMVGNIYICQPLLALMAHQLGVPEHMAASVAVATQFGYALGILLVVPLADMAEPARLVRWLLVLTALGLLGAAASPGVPVLLVASACLAMTTVVPQVLIPLAPALALPRHRGRIVGALQTGLVLGILLSRTLSGAIAGYSGSWRASYVVAALLTIALAFVLPAFMPAARPDRPAVRYGALLASLPPLLRHRPLLLSMGLSFCVFAAFSALWATLAFHLETPAFALGAAGVGLFGLWGAPGALLAPMAGRLCDRWGTAPVNALGIAAAAASFLVAGSVGMVSLLGLVLTVNLLDFGVQAGQVANQTRIFGLGDAIRGRLNTLYMVATFGGGALGALAGGAVWAAAGWTGVCILGAVLVCSAGLLLAIVTAGTVRPARAQLP